MRAGNTTQIEIQEMSHNHKMKRSIVQVVYCAEGKSCQVARSHSFSFSGERDTSVAIRFCTPTIERKVVVDGRGTCL